MLAYANHPSGYFVKNPQYVHRVPNRFRMSSTYAVTPLQSALKPSAPIAGSRQRASRSAAFGIWRRVHRHDLDVVGEADSGHRVRRGVEAQSVLHLGHDLGAFCVGEPQVGRRSLHDDDAHRHGALQVRAGRRGGSEGGPRARRLGYHRGAVVHVPWFALARPILLRVAILAPTPAGAGPPGRICSTSVSPLAGISAPRLREASSAASSGTVTILSLP